MVGSHDVRLIEALDEQSAFVVDRQAERTPRYPSAARGEEASASANRAAKTSGSSIAVDESEEAALFAKLRSMRA